MVRASAAPAGLTATELANPCCRARAVRTAAATAAWRDLALRAGPDDVADADADVTVWRDVGCPSAPTGTCEKSWSRVTGAMTGLLCRSVSRVETKVGLGAQASGATPTTPRGAGVPAGPRRLGAS